MSELTAFQAAKLADDVYSLTKLPALKDAFEYLNREYGDVFSVSENELLKAKTGGPWFIKCQTAFGFTLLGKGSLKGQAFFIFRGTQYLADWLTNLNIGVSRTRSGQPVHDGFNMAFKTMLPKLTEFMKLVNAQNVTQIHCIGHSLGGGLATLCGDWLQNGYSRKPYIYSFGSPRVGLYDFAKCCTKNIGAERIFRAYHRTDIVPCIPIWPYVHTPNSGQDYYLPSPGLIPMAEYHDMKHYISSVRDKTWSALGALRMEQKDDNGIVRWLKQSAPVSLTISTIEWLNQAITYVIEKCMDGAGILISKAFSTSFTLLDQLAYILKKGIDLSESVSSWVMYLMRKIMQMLGLKPLVKAAEFTRDFIRSILMRLQKKVHEYTQAALSKLMVKGRAI